MSTAQANAFQAPPHALALLEPIRTRNLDQYRMVHASKRYGVSAGRREGLILPYVRALAPRAMLDYGAGRCETISRFARLLGTTGYTFDPAIPGIETIPAAFLSVSPEERFVLCSHVLEHLDVPEIDTVLAHIATLSPNAMIIVPTTAARQVLPNGENAHATVRRKDWWQARIAKHFPQAECKLLHNSSELFFVTFKPMAPKQVPRHRTRLAPRSRKPKLFELATLRGRRVAIVGRAKSLLGAGDGTRIDSYDFVIRINTELPLDPALAVDLGTRTDLIFTCRGCAQAAHKATLAGVPTIAYDREFRKVVSRQGGYTPFTGTMCILECLRAGATEIFATGMDLYSGPSINGRGGHLRLSRKNSYAFHDPEGDKQLLRSLLDTPKPCCGGEVSWESTIASYAANLAANTKFVPSDALLCCLLQEAPLMHHSHRKRQ